MTTYPNKLRIINRLSKKVILSAVGIPLLSVCALTANAAGLTYSFTNTFDTATVDGSYTDWQPLASNVQIPMYEAGNPTKDIFSNLYLRYDCNSQTMFGLVLKQPSYSIDGAPWIKIYELGNSPQVDDGDNPPNGVQPEFSWVPPSASVQPNTEGYEASFSLAPGGYTMEAHVNMVPGRTSSTGRGDYFIYLDLTCPTESLGISKTANPFYLENYDWTITKAVDPDSHTMFIGDSAQSSTYTVAVDQTVTLIGQKVNGEITIANNTSKTAIIAEVIDTITPGNIPVEVDCGATFPYTLTAGQTLTCSYTQTLASAFSGQNEVIVVPANGSELFGGEATANFAFDANTPKEAVGYPTVDVVDTKEGVLQNDLGEDKTFTYTTDFGCPTDPAQYVNGVYQETYDNTATIQKTANGNTTVIDSADAVVAKTCYAPVVTKTANPSITQTLGWTLNKQVNPTTLSMNAGESNPVHYTVTVGTEVINTSYAVSGTITVANPNPTQSMTVPVTDMLAGGINATVDCGGSATLTVPANSSATCTYSTNLPDSATRLNTATATLNNIGFNGTATVDFSGVVPTVIAPTPSLATVTDTNLPAGSPWTTSGTMTQNYDETLTCSTNPADYQNGHYSFPHPNTAAITGTDKSSTATVNVDCYAPVVSKTATPAIARTLGWTLNKSVTPDHLSMNIGDSGQAVHYTVTVGTEPIADLTQYTVTGSIVITNTNPNQPMTVAIADMLPDSTNLVLNCDGGLNPTIPAGGQVNCTYSASLPNGSARTNTATATLNGLVVNGTAPVDFSNVTPTDTGPTPSPATVTDTNAPAGSPWTTSGPMTQNYDETLTCSTNPADYSGGHYSFPHPNTAAITDTTKSSTATVNVDCYAPLVSKTATTSFIRTHQWGIDKMANIGPNDILLQVGQTYYFTYDITVNVTGQNDTGVTVEGDITVQNPNPNSAMDVSVADALPDATNVTLDCGGTLSVPAGNSASCHYHATLPDNSTGTNRTNVATVTLNGVDFNAQTAVTFGTPTQEKDTCVTVTDQIAANEPWTAAMNTAVVTLGTVCVSDSLPKVFSYPLTAGPYDAAAASACQLPNNPAGLINNTATYTVTDNSSVSGTAEEHVPVCVPQAGSCTLTQGYWKTHSTHGKAPTSEGWIVFAPTNVAGVVDNSQVVNLADVTFFRSGKTYYQVLWTPPKGNAYYNLAHQWIATYLNQINGASMPANVTNAFMQGWTLLATYTPAQVAGSKTIANQFKALYPILDSYNNGLVGPGHCSNDAILFGGE